jgi:hypothetical protein
VTPPPAPELPAPPATPPATPPGAATARLETPRFAGGAYELLGPHVRREGAGYLVQVQVLNRAPSMVRRGSVLLTVGEASAGAPEPFSMKQGQLLGVPVPRGTTRVRVTLRDESGKTSLEQDVALTTP